MNAIEKSITRLRIGKEGKQVYSLLQKTGPLTKNDLLAAIKTNFTTLNRIMEPLEEKRLIQSVGIGESSGGRKPVLYDVNPKRFYVLGIDISRPFTEVVVTDPKMNILYKKTFAMDESHTPDKTVQMVADLFNEALTQLKIEKKSIIGAGLGAVGPLDREKGVMIRPKNFAAPNWSGAPIKDLLERALGLTVIIDNGANTAILAEHKFGIGKGYSNIAYFNCSIGIRTGVISDGTIVRTINDAEDAFGHMVINVDGELCDCGNNGCIECYSSIHAIVRKYNALLKQGHPSGIANTIEDIDYMDICQAADKNDNLAREIIINAAITFGVGLANYINLLNPNLVILGGKLIECSELYYQVCAETALKRIYTKESSRILFSKGGLFGEDAIALGAAVMVMEYYLA